MKLRDQFETVCLQAGLRLSTQRSYWNWSRNFIAKCGFKSRDEMTAAGCEAVSGFLTAQARRGCSASTQAQALNALVFLYAHVLKSELGKLDFQKPTRVRRLPAVPVSHEETVRLLDALESPMNLLCRLIYGSALRVNDALRIRLRDLDFSNSEIRIMDSKGGKDRLVMMPAKLRDELLALATHREAEHLREKRNGGGWVHLPGLYGTKNPKAHFDSGWQYLFASTKTSKDPRSTNMGRHHVTSAAVQDAMRRACRKLRLKKNVTPHGLRHSAARRMKEKGVQLHVIQKILGHKDPETTMIYLGINESIPAGCSPLD